MAVSPARKVAFDVLLAVERGRAHSDDLLRGNVVSALGASDRHLATALVLGVLRWQLALDREVRQFLERPGAKLDAEVRIALRLGAFQLLYMDRIPAHAAIDESVELAKHAGQRFASRMVNAVLRKVAGIPRQGEGDPARAYPAWMVERWEHAYGDAATRAICAYGQLEPGTTIRLADSAAQEELRSAGFELEPGCLLSASRSVERGDVTATTAFREGRVWFQDEGSQLVAEIAGRGQCILDACAAPGGKTLVLAARNPEAKVVACEVSAQRLAHLRERLAPLGERVECRLGDAGEVADVATYDLVLADVPCSGAGRPAAASGETGSDLELRVACRAARRARRLFHVLARAGRE
jgi:16S rRNA (cytosine967-C5)-methyltransferase